MKTLELFKQEAKNNYSDQMREDILQKDPKAQASWKIYKKKA